MQQKIIIVTLGIGLFLLMFSAGTADAVPVLQLYMPGAEYNEETESWLATDNPFTLQVLGASKNGKVTEIHDLSLYIAVPVDWLEEGGSVTVTGPGYGSGTTLTFDTNTSQGTPVLPTPLGKKPKHLPSHGVYPTYYHVLDLPDMDVGSGTDAIDNYNPGETGEDVGAIYEYRIEYQGVFGIHMDVAGIAVKKNGKEQSVFAPFSHDADAPVPEPGTLLLLGTGMGLFAWRRFRHSILNSSTQ